jgi:chromosome transmission fidelity protein 4
LELDIDKTLLQYLAIECREGEDRGMRALEVVQLMKDRTGRMLEAAGKVAERYGRSILGEKIREVSERRLGGDEMDEDFP